MGNAESAAACCSSLDGGNAPPTWGYDEPIADRSPRKGAGSLDAEQPQGAASELESAVEADREEERAAPPAREQPWRNMEGLLREVAMAPVEELTTTLTEMLAVGREICPQAGAEPDAATFKLQADTPLVTMWKHRRRSLTVKRTKRFDYSPEVVWLAGQNVEFMENMGMRDCTIEQLAEGVQLVSWTLKLPLPMRDRSFCAFKLLHKRPEIHSYESLLVSAAHPDHPAGSGSGGPLRAFIFAYSNVQAAPGAPLENGVPTASTNMSLSLTDLKGSVSPKLLSKLMVSLSDKQAKKTTEVLRQQGK